MAVIPIHKNPLCSERILHLVDVENLCGGPIFSLAEARWSRFAYERIAPHGFGDQVVIASSHMSASSAWFAWPRSARRLLRSGQDGADLELLDVLAEENVQNRYDRVVIGSGDGIFAFPAARLQAAGCAVTVVARRAALSRELRLASGEVRFIGTEHRSVRTVRGSA